MRRMFVGSLVVLAATLMAPRMVSAQAVAGDREILTFANIFSISGDGFNSTSGSIFVNVGKFLTDRFQVGGGPNITISRTSSEGQDGANSDIGFGVNGFVRYYFGEASATLKPYAGGEVNINRLNPRQDQEDFSVADEMFLAGVAGVKNYLTENAAIDFKGSYGFLANDPGGLRMLLFTVGLTYIF